MAVSGDNRAPVIIKRKKVIGGGGHHGGAWKVAYADFVTAMMAFFLLMWLLNATTEKQRKGIADYFSPTIAISRTSGGGEGSFGGESVTTEETLPQMGAGATNVQPTESKQARGETGTPAANAGNEPSIADQDSYAKLEAALQGRGGESTVADPLQRHIITRVTDEGLVVELYELDDSRLFDPDSARPTALMDELMHLVASVADLVENSVAIEAHTHARPVMVAVNPVWDLSTERANHVRLMLLGNGLQPPRIKRITGHADREQASPDPMAIRNNRIEIIFLRSGS